MPKRTKNYTEEDLQRALQEISDGNLIQTVAKKYNIPRGTVQNRLYGRTHKSSFGPSAFLTEKEEKTVVEWLLSNHKKGFPRRKEDVQVVVKKFLDNEPRANPFKENIPGKKWYTSFLWRHPELSIRTPEAVTSSSAKVSENDIRGWFSQIKCYLEENNAFNIFRDPKRIFNGDETNFQMCPKNGKVLAPKGTKNVYETDYGQAKDNLTVMFTFSASGLSVPPMIIYSYKRMQMDILESIPDDFKWQKSESGWMTSEIFEHYVEKVFYPFLQQNKVPLPVIFFVDGHKTHMTYSLSKLCDSLQIITICLYPNATRILQPADVSVFKSLKSAWAKELQNWRRQNLDCKFTRTKFAPLLQMVIQRYLRPDIIQNGFKACGLYPFDPNTIDFSKCLGTNFSTNVEQESPVSSEKSSVLDLKHFKEIVGKQKIAQLKQFDPVKRPCTADFALLHDIYKVLVRAPALTVREREKTPSVDITEFVYGNEEYTEVPVPFTNDGQSEGILNIEELPIVIADSTGNIKDYLPIASTPQRLHKQEKENRSYIISSSHFRKFHEEKMEKRISAENLKEENRLKRKEKALLAQQNKEQKVTQRQKKKEEKQRKQLETAMLKARKREEIERKKQEKLAAKATAKVRRKTKKGIKIQAGNDNSKDVERIPELRETNMEAEDEIAAEIEKIFQDLQDKVDEVENIEATPPKVDESYERTATIMDSKNRITLKRKSTKDKENEAPPNKKINIRYNK